MTDPEKPTQIDDDALDSVEGAGLTMFLTDGKPVRAKTQGVILQMDEADALFGKRTEVQDSHDRYANMETAYLKDD